MTQDRINLAYQNALSVQDACNLSGVVKSFADDMDVVNFEMNEGGHGEEFRGNHPVVVLYVDKLMQLTGNSGASFEAYSNAHKACKAKVACQATHVNMDSQFTGIFHSS